jgi:hypothetical protein
LKATSVFIAVFLAIAAGRGVFAPDRMPSGIGFYPSPFEAFVRPSVLGQGKVARIRNTSHRDLSKVRVVLKKSNGQHGKSADFPRLAPNASIELGWLEGWQISDGDRLKVSAAGHLPGLFQY